MRTCCARQTGCCAEDGLLHCDCLDAVRWQSSHPYAMVSPGDSRLSAHLSAQRPNRCSQPNRRSPHAHASSMSATSSSCTTSGREPTRMTSTRRRRRRRKRERCRCSLPQQIDSAAQIDAVRQDGCRFRLGKAPAKASAQIPIKPPPSSLGELSLFSIWQQLWCSDGLMEASVSTNAP